MSKIITFDIEHADTSYINKIKILNSEFSSTSRSRSRDVCELIGQQAEGLRRLGRLKESIHLFLKTLHLSRQLGIRSGECWSLWGIASAFRSKGWNAHSRKIFSAAVDSSRRANDYRCYLWSVAEQSELDRIEGQLSKALPAHRLLYTEFLRIGDIRGVCWALSGAAQILKLQGFLQEASVEFRRAYEISSLANDTISAAWALRGQAEVARELGDSAIAIKLATEAEQAFRDIGYELGAAYAMKTRAKCLIFDDEVKEALTLALECHEKFQYCSEARGVAFSKFTLGLAYMRLGERAISHSLFRQSQYTLSVLGIREPRGFSPTQVLQRFE